MYKICNLRDYDVHQETAKLIRQGNKYVIVDSDRCVLVRNAKLEIVASRNLADIVDKKRALEADIGIPSGEGAVEIVTELGKKPKKPLLAFQQKEDGYEWNRDKSDKAMERYLNKNKSKEGSGDPEKGDSKESLSRERIDEAMKDNTNDNERAKEVLSKEFLLLPGSGKNVLLEWLKASDDSTISEDIATLALDMIAEVPLRSLDDMKDVGFMSKQAYANKPSNDDIWRIKALCGLKQAKQDTSEFLSGDGSNIDVDRKELENYIMTVATSDGLDKKKDEIVQVLLGLGHKTNEINKWLNSEYNANKTVEENLVRYLTNNVGAQANYDKASTLTVSSSSKKAKDAIEYVAVKEPEEAYEKLIELLRSQSYTEMIEDLDDILSSAKLKKVLEMGFDSPYADLKLSTQITSVSVGSLMPTQNEIDLTKSIMYPLTKTKDISIYYKSPVTIVAPIVTFNKQFIIDGHHRWSQLYCMNPKAKISVVDFKSSEGINAIQLLRIAQVAIGLEAGKVPSASANKALNIYNLSKVDVRQYIADEITDNCVSQLVQLVRTVKDDQSAIDYITTNAMTLKNNNYPIHSAPDREYMPQFDEAPPAMDLMDGAVPLV